MDKDYIDQLIVSIMGAELDNNRYWWSYDGAVLHVRINDKAIFISKDSDEMEKIEELWKEAKN